MIDLGSRVSVVVEVPRGGFVKRRPSGRIDYVSPLPSPFNYGSVPGTLAPDGDPIDVVLLGPRKRIGHREQTTVVAVVRMWDDGKEDPKLVCSGGPLTPGERRLVERFFRRYVPVKGLLNLIRGGRGRTAFESFDG